MNEVIDFLNTKLDLENKKIVVAVSGGPDSMALLQILLNEKKKKNFKIICAHVNHKLRKESDDEKIMVQDFCNQNDIIFEYLEIKKYKNDNFHNQAREIRYNFFDDLMKKYNAKYLFTAHHGDDLIETILMRITRGSSVKGYSGFNTITKKDNYFIVKPLVFVTKEQLLEFVKENNIPYAIDKSNEKDVYTRNRYRKYILPVLKDEDENIHKKYLKFSVNLNKYSDYISRVVENILDSVIIDNKIIIDKFNNLDVLIKEEVLKKFLEKNYPNKINLLNDKHIEQILFMINSKKPNMDISLPDNKILTKEYNEVKFKNSVDDDYQIPLENEIELNGKKIKIVESSNDTTNYTIKLNSLELSMPLYIRNIRMSDKIKVKGLNGTKKVKDIYINNKIPIGDRKKIPLLVDSNGEVLWILGIKKSKYDKSNKENYDIIIRYI